MRITDYLKKHQRPTGVNEGEEKAFYLHYRYLLDQHEIFSRFSGIGNNPFEIIRANIIIRSLLNKKRIEDKYTNLSKRYYGEELERKMQNALGRTASFLYEDTLIYVPIFSPAINQIYGKQYAKLFQEPYEKILALCDPLVVDPFDQYGSKIYDSYFSRLVTVARKDGKVASYDYANCRLYLINDQGRLDAELCLFDKDLVDPDTANMIKRLNEVAFAYWDEDRNALLEAMLSNRLISRSAYLALKERR